MMTPLQRFRVILLVLVAVFTVAGAVVYLLAGARGFPTFLPGFVMLPVLGVPLWVEIQQTRAGQARPLLTPDAERRFVRVLVASGIGLVLVPLAVLGVTLALGTLRREYVMLLTIGSAVMVSLVPLLLVVRLRRRKR